MNDHVLHEPDLKLILNNFCSNPKIEYVSSKILPSSGNVEGFMGEYFTLEIIYKVNKIIKEQQFFVKHMPTYSTFQQKIAIEHNLYGKEIFFLNYLLKEYEKYHLEISFAPKCYFSKNNQILVLENLISSQFKLSETNKLYDLDQCKVGLEALALYHGSSLLYEEIKSQELGRIFRLDEQFPEMFEEHYYDLTFQKHFARLHIEKTIRGIKYMLHELKDELKYNDDFENNLTVQNILSCFTAKTNWRKATGHGDLWYNNIFFKYDNFKAVKCAIVDYQVMRYFYPTFDVLLFIHLNTNYEFRKTNVPYLLKYYYDTLSDVFEKRGFNIDDVVPLRDFNASIKFVESNALFTVISIGTLVFLSKKTINELYSGMGGDTADAFKNHYELFCRDFKDDLNYRKMLSDAVNDFYVSFTNNINKEDE